MFAVITENDVSQWNDQTGLLYHFPKKYLHILKPGTKVIYYKGRMIDKSFLNSRLSKNPHYFGTATIGEIASEIGTSNYFARIDDFVLFNKALDFKVNGVPLEDIPSNLASNYWRDGVRWITEEVYNRIVSASNGISGIYNDSEIGDEEFASIGIEGGVRTTYSTKYERSKELRDKAVKFHGYTCTACKLNFKDMYGTWGEGYIHVHHLNPISTLDKNEKLIVDVEKDMVVVCANCHSMIHRRKDKTLTIQELISLIKEKKNGNP